MMNSQAPFIISNGVGILIRTLLHLPLPVLPVFFSRNTPEVQTLAKFKEKEPPRDYHDAV
jgi:hypothetical protein